MISDHVHEGWECPECDKTGMTSKEFRSHGVREHAEENPFADFFPEYNVCRCGGEGVNLYMKAETEDGPYYMAWEDRDHVEEMHPWELKRHDWEWIERENTPFPQFED